MVNKPQGDLGYLRGKFLNFYAVKLIDINQNLMVNIKDLLASQQQFQHIKLQEAQFPVTDYQKVAATAGGIEEFQSGYLFMEGGKFVPASGGGQFFYAVEFFPQSVNEQRVYQLQYVLFAGIVRPYVMAFFIVHNALEHSAEYGRGYFAPVEGAALDKRVPHGAVEIGAGEGFLEKTAVYIRKLV
jgi:hypothetical protein